MSFDVIVIGSGFGGAITACRLAEAGYKVLILERGRRWDKTNYPRKPEDPWTWSDTHPERQNGWALPLIVFHLDFPSYRLLLIQMIRFRHAQLIAKRIGARGQGPQAKDSCDPHERRPGAPSALLSRARGPDTSGDPAISA